MQDSSFRVEGDILIVRENAMLPMFCLKSDKPLRKEDMVGHSLEWAPRASRVSAASAITYAKQRKKFGLLYGIAPEVHARYRNRLLLKFAIAFVSCLAMFATAVLDVNAIVTLILFLICFISVVLVPFGNTPIKVVSHLDGEFGIAGCHPDFLKRIEKM